MIIDEVNKIALGFQVKGDVMNLTLMFQNNITISYNHVLFWCQRLLWMIITSYEGL